MAFDLLTAAYVALTVACIYALSTYWNGPHHKSPTAQRNLLDADVQTILTTAPPRPLTIPFFGTVRLFLPRNIFSFNKAISNIAAECGPIFRIKMGRTELYVVCSYDLLREATIEKPLDFIQRPADMRDLLAVNPMRLGFVEGDGPAFMAYRKFVLVKLRSLGFGRRSMEDCILQECTELIKRLENNSKVLRQLTLRDLLTGTTANVIFSILCSKRYAHDDPKLTEVTRAGTGSIKQTAYTGIVMGFPFLGHFTPFIQRVRQHHQFLHNFVKKLIDERVQRAAVSGEKEGVLEPQDFIDIFLEERRKQIKNGEQTTMFTLDALAYSIHDLFLGGFETSASTIQWLLLVMLHESDLKRRIHAEIDELRVNRAAHDRLITLFDADHLPLTVATIWEVWRMFPLVPFGIPHASDGRKKLGGYDIEPGKGILFHLWTIHRDPVFWHEPHRFFPERFLETNENNKTVFRQPEKVVVFSMGRRSCIGEQLGRKETFLLFANLMNAFDFRLRCCDGTKPPTLPKLEEQPGMIMYAPEFEVDFMRR